MSVDVNALVTNNLDIWSSTIKAKAATGRGSKSKRELYGVKKLRELILELAVRGLLVPQDSSDEPANVLLERIATEKARLVEEKKIKKPKVLRSITPEERAFAPPKGWCWVRLQEIGHDLGQSKPDKSFTYIDVGSINKNLGIVEEPSILSDSEAPSRARKLVKKGTVIYSTVRPYLLNIAVIDKDFSPSPIASTAFAVLHPLNGILSDYVYRYLRSPTFVAYVESVQSGIAYPAVNDKQFFSGIIPIPPTSEQHRIVTKVNELMTLCDQLEQQQESSITAHQTLVETLLSALVETASHTQGDEGSNKFQQAWQRIAENFDLLFTTEHSIDQLKQTILQLAVMGKLVPQDPNNEPASVLLEKIAAEKAQLIKDKKIKKQKPLPLIGDEEKPFELPDGWEWCRIAEFAVVGTGATPSRTNHEYYNPAGINWVTSGETAQDFVFDTKEKVSTKAVKETNVSVYPVGTLILAMYGQGKTRGQITELMVEAGTNQACAAIQFINKNDFHRKYVKLYFEKAYEELRSHASGGAQPNLNVGKVSLTAIPLPPLKEKERIVAKVNELRAICDTMLERIKAAQTTQLKLTDAIAEQAVN